MTITTHTTAPPLCPLHTVPLLPGWVECRAGRFGEPCALHYVRSDGAYVWSNTDFYWANETLAGHRPWTAYKPDGRYLAVAQQKRSRRIHPPNCMRRWKTPLAAMQALDRECPIGELPEWVLAECDDLVRELGEKA